LGQHFSLATAIALNALPVLIAGLVLLVGTKFLRSPASSPVAA
jgi:hypothetical protein